MKKNNKTKIRFVFHYPISLSVSSIVIIMQIIDLSFIDFLLLFRLLFLCFFLSFFFSLSSGFSSLLLKILSLSFLSFSSCELYDRYFRSCVTFFSICWFLRSHYPARRCQGLAVGLWWRHICVTSFTPHITLQTSHHLDQSWPLTTLDRLQIPSTCNDKFHMTRHCPDKSSLWPVLTTDHTGQTTNPKYLQ